MHYLDNAATTRPLESVGKAVLSAMNENFGNPSSLYRLGIDAEGVINEARKNVADALGCEEGELCFTSCATESSNTVIFGVAENYGKRKKKKAVTTTIEHPSVAEAFNKLEKQGFEIVRVSPDENGEITAEMITDAVDDNTFLVSCMLVNNETGYILPIDKAFRSIKKKYPDCITHCDAVQGFLKIDFKVKNLFADCISLSGHKIHAPKGVGALYVKKGVRVAPLLVGGGQEKGKRSGTECTPLIAGFGQAVKELSPTVEERLSKAESLKNYLLDKISLCDGIEINSKPDSSPYINSIAVLNIKSETLLHYLEARGVYVSSGSACSRGKKSSVLKEFRVGEKRLDSTIRVSFSEETTTADIDILIEEIKNAQKELCKIK
ncbi:MAG: cysteine desulfurase [Ruminococcus sp.]|nr:cysteine desulfurase [Ruminococcus sp.]